jgi:SulP family sulfate permease
MLLASSHSPIAYLFFGTITYVEEAARELLDAAKWNRNPIRFLVIDLSLVLGVDLSASEAFVRLQRSLAIKNVILVLCGFQMDSPIGRALKSVDVFEGSNVEVFSDINEATEWTENVYLKAWFDTVKEEERVPEAKPIGVYLVSEECRLSDIML